MLTDNTPRTRFVSFVTLQAIPDVSAQADNFRIFLQGSPLLIGGTSASSPTFAGFVSLLNDVRLSNGMPPLGFLNPFIYSTGQTGFNDITVGNNPGCGTPGNIAYYNFHFKFAHLFQWRKDLLFSPFPLGGMG